MKRILLVDDEHKVAIILARGLKTLGTEYSIDTATNGKDAALKIRQQTYDVLITDYKMPQVTGLNLAQWVRKASPQTRIIIMTAHGTPKLKQALDTLSIDGYIEKPFRLTQLRQMVQNNVVQAEPKPYQNTDILVRNILEELYQHTNAYCVLLLSGNGYPVEMVGHTDSFDVYSLGGLIAANCAIFKNNYHEGEDSRVYSYNINGDLFLAVSFSLETRLGIVRLYSGQAAKKLLPIAQHYTIAQQQSTDALMPNLDNEFTDVLTDRIDTLLELPKNGIIA